MDVIRQIGLSRRGCGASRLIVTAAAGLAIGFGPVTTAQAEEFGIASFVAEPRANTYAPDPLVAGAHPDLYTRVEFTSEERPNPSYNPTFCTLFPSPQYCDETVRGALATPSSLAIDLPRGVVLNPQVVPACSRADYAASVTNCADARVGQGTIVLGDGSVRPLDLYSVAPSDEEPASIGMVASGAKVGFLTARVTPEGGYAIRTRTDHIARIFGPIVELELRMWGVPTASNPGASADAPHRAFVTNPTSCGEPAVTSLRVSTYEDPHRTHEATAGTPPATGCDSLPWDGSIEMRTIGRAAGGPAALDVDLLFPFTTDPTVRANANLKRVVVRLPEGVSINAGVARDLTGCSDGAFGKDNGRDATCPTSSKIGTIGIKTPLLRDPLPGDVYMGEPKPGNLFRLFLYAEGPGVRVKLEGEVRPDPVTGQLTAIFDDNPQIPFTRFNLRFRGGTRSALAMPTTCGPKTAVASFEPWSGQPALSLSSTFQIYRTEDGEPCPEEPPFDPDFVAGTTIPTAGGDTGFSVTFGRGSDQDEWLGGLKLNLPAGLLGRLADFPLCPVATARANECSDDSLVGSTVVSAGVGDAMLVLPGRVFLTEPPKPGQIAGLAIVVRAVAGPYDLGTVVVMSGITVNPDTSLTVESDPLPTILEGIPLRLRRVTVNVDRPGFMFNPTDCSPKRITGAVLSSTGREVEVAVPFAVRGCADLPFAPTMTLATRAPSERVGTVGLTVKLTAFPGHANNRQVQVLLPPRMGARLDGPLQSPCTETQFAHDECPDASRIGTASATTPVLPEPLVGQAYFLENPDPSGNALPKLAVRLKGAIELDLIGDVAVTRAGRVVTTFTAVPDAPISEFELALDHGHQAVLSVNDACREPMYAMVSTIAHSGKTSVERVRVDVAGCPQRGARTSRAKKPRGKRQRADRAARATGGGATR